MLERNIVEINSLIEYAKLIYGEDIFKEWFDGIDLENAFFMRSFYKIYANKNDFKINKLGDNSLVTVIENSELSNIFHEQLDLLRLFNKHLGAFVEQSACNTKNFHKHKKNAIMILGSTQEQPSLSALSAYIDSKTKAKTNSRYRKLISGILSNCPDNLLVFLKKKNKLFYDKFNKDLFYNASEMRTATLLSMPKHIFKEHRERWYTLSKQFESISKDRFLAWFILKELLVVLSLSYAVFGLFRKYRPRLIIGAFEKSAYGNLLFSFSRAQSNLFPCKIVNIQHGLITESAMLDKCRFDRFFVWDRVTYSIIKSSGYSPMSTVRVVGNKVWEDLAVKTSSGSNSSQTKVRNWKNQSKVILFCTQPLDMTKIEKSLSPIMEFIRNKDIKLLVRTHPAQSINDFTPWLDNYVGDLKEKVRVVGSHEVSLSDCFSISDLVCSIHSTVLVDAVFAGKNSLSIMPELEESSKMYSFFNEYEIPVATNEKDCFNMLTDLFYGNKSLQNNPNSHLHFEVEFNRQLKRLFWF